MIGSYHSGTGYNASLDLAYGLVLSIFALTVILFAL